MLCVELPAPLLLLGVDIDPEAVTVEILDVYSGVEGSNIGAKKAIAFSSCPVARALASFHSSSVISKFA